MKNIGLILATGLISAVAAVGGYRYIDNRESESPELLPENNYKVNFANYTETPSPAATEFTQAAAAVTPAVVHIKTTYTGSQSRRNPIEEFFGGPGSGTPARASGSGVLVSADGYIVTNNHVVENASAIEVVLPDRRSFAGKLIGRDPSTDLALIKVEGSNLPVVAMGNSDEVQVGEWVLAVGYPLSLNSTVTAGIISAKGRSIGILDQPGQGNPGATPGVSTAIESFIQTDAAINPGNSGGALVNTNGQLIGINAAIASQTGSYAGYGFAIPINLAKKVINDLRSYGEVRRGFLGVSFPTPATEDERLREQGINPGSVQGVYIMDVQSGGAAAAAGLRAGDIIQSIDGVRVNSSSEFSERIARHRPGDRVELTYLRNGRTTTTSATLKGEEETERLARSTSTTALRSKLGVSVSPLPARAKQYYRLNSGLLVTAVERGSFFERYGLTRNTIITQVNGRPVNNAAELDAALALSRNGVARLEVISPEGMRYLVNFPLGA
ncbi:trypsin-like peptidase domain-containing protein [Paradesertivirga mongoliensis]|uniref:Trypsin-like peptidase domain-containing protein n=1 Tax=Paradesertivirga mongoliensis TaxID=2100740 RepID=A0ABW4ZP87_9SPHI|nr:trypsin-like peptidase domain-containing protein [Pedobacter mongoliensis]